ncbi:hypothetical protein [Streptomyces variegatus]|uniref:hypothetical protein n=1 Tax=Streptomyces variegatus TaxID=284040 RepID=UPI003C2CBDAE
MRQVAKAPGDVLIGCSSEPFVEFGGGSEDFAQGDEDAVVGGGQLGQRVGRLVGGGGLANALGEVGDGGAQRQVTGRTGVGVEVLVAVDVVSGGRRRATASAARRDSSS